MPKESGWNSDGDTTIKDREERVGERENNQPKLAFAPGVVRSPPIFSCGCAHAWSTVKTTERDRDRERER